MDPEDIQKGRLFTWAVLISECVIALTFMVWLARIEPGILDYAELEMMDSATQQMMRSEWRAAYSASSKANVAGPVYFVVVTGFSLFVLGGNWTVRIVYGVFLFVLAGVTAAAPWLSPHRVVLEPDTLPIICGVVAALLHAAGGAIMLFVPPVRLFLHPRRMMFTAPQQAR